MALIYQDFLYMFQELKETAHTGGGVKFFYCIQK